MIDVAAIIGFVLLGISELLPLLPIPSNGLLHSIFIGLQNSIKNNNADVELAKQILNKHPYIADIVKQISTNPAVIDNVKALLSNVQLNNLVSKFQTDTDLQYISALIQEHPEKTKELKRTLEIEIPN